MWGCDYAPYMTPASEGGKGPENAREVLGIECYHHYGITLHPLVEGERAAATVYNLTRTLWHKPRADGLGVQDDNHTWEVKDASELGRFSAIVFRKNEKSPQFINILNIPRWQYEDGPGAKWFDQKFRVVTVGIIAAEITNNFRHRNDYLKKALDDNEMTIVGRKKAQQHRAWATDRMRLNRVILMRHPQLANLAAYDEDAYQASLIAHHREMRQRYLTAAKEQPDTHRGAIAAARYLEWAEADLRRCKNIARSHLQLAHLVPDEELVAA